MELAHAFGMAKTLLIWVEQINGLFIFDLKGTPSKCKSALERHSKR